MSISRQIADWLETHWASPAYSGWLLMGIALCLFGAANNTMAGWLYVISGTILALLVLGAILPTRALAHLKVLRSPIEPVSVGSQLMVELAIENPTNQPKTLLQVQDLLPSTIASPVQTAIELVPPQSTHRWIYETIANRRGIYQWHEVQLRSGTPLGLFWVRRSREAPAQAIIYPTILPLDRCSLVDTIGQDNNLNLSKDRPYRAATEGLTKTLRDYRRGDSTRLIHWRASARFGELQVRELETVTGGQEVIICLDGSPAWQEEDFEQAVIAAASLYFYASRSGLTVKLWTAETGLVRGDRLVLEALAAVVPQEKASPPALPLIWLTQNPATLEGLPNGSRWVLFPPVDSGVRTISSPSAGIEINPEQPLRQQLQKPLLGNRSALN